MTTPAALMSLPEIKKFLLAGKATFTLVSKRTGGNRKTFEVVQAEPKPGFVKPGYIVRLLTGPENSSDYRYLGFVYETRAGLHHMKINHESWGEEAAAAFSWLLRAIDDPLLYSDKFAAQAEFWHAGRCGRCGHLLTDPVSISLGLGPVCAEKSM